MPDMDIPIETFIADEHKGLERFMANWKAEHAKDPECWPLKQGLSEWWEHLIMFATSGDA